jgi:F-type H+-transporting ATPase subunit delta
VQERARGYADALLGGLKDKDLRTASDQLSAFEGLLAGSDQLRLALASPNTLPLARRAIISDLLEGKVAPPVLALLAFTAQYGTGADYAADVAELAAAARARSEGMVAAPASPLGRTAARERLAGFGTEVLSSCDERRLGNIEDELFRFMRIVEGNDELMAALTTGELPEPVRRNVVSQLLDRRAAKETGRMATYAVAIGRPRDYLELLAGLVDLVADEGHRRVGDVRSAVPMTEVQRLHLGAALTRLTGRAVEVRVTVDDHVLGGFVANVGDIVVDASLRHRLGQASATLSATIASPAGGQEK